MTATSDTARPPEFVTDAPDIARHEHAWVTESHHRTSEGEVLYVRCEGCRALRIDLQSRPDAPPAALTKPISAVGNNR
jgi:hypothetical protein